MVLNARSIFCLFLFSVGIKENSLIWYKGYVLRTSYVEKVLLIIDARHGLKIHKLCQGSGLLLWFLVDGCWFLTFFGPRGICRVGNGGYR